jgi:hypothetical protein
MVRKISVIVERVSDGRSILGLDINPQVRSIGKSRSFLDRNVSQKSLSETRLAHLPINPSRRAPC